MLSRFARLNVLFMLFAVVVAASLLAQAPKNTRLEITPEPLPDPGLPGFRFPTDSAVLTQWVVSNNTEELSKHAWGLWAALTKETVQQYNGQKLRVFETWQTPSDVRSSPAVRSRRNPRQLTPLHQLLDRRLTRAGQPTILGFVKYDPSGAKHVGDEHLFSAKHLNDLIKTGTAQIPDFPATATSLKAVFQPLLGTTRYVRLNTWPGPPTPAKPFPQGSWGQCVWIDTQTTPPSSHPLGAVDTTCNGTSRTPESTYTLGDFIHFKMDNGKYAVLIAMHVTTREIGQWTWQTYWWVPKPDAPQSPSSTAFASARPAQLQGPARNFAACAAYAMEFPPQPLTGGQNSGESVYCYNPYLEASFDPATLPLSKPGTHQGQTVSNNVGVQTNCMSCHAFARYPSAGQSEFYTGDRYVDANDPVFKNALKVDFLWSIPGNAQ